MKAKLLKRENMEWVESNTNEATHLLLVFPFEKNNILRERYLPIQLKGERANTNKWSFNGDLANPTLKPSIKTTLPSGEICHSFVNNGTIKFLSDCTHKFKNCTIDLLDIN